jgi:hypothetical protein
VPPSLPLLVYASQLGKTQYADLRDVARIQAGVVDIGALDEAMQCSIERRLEFAEELLLFAESLARPEASRERHRRPQCRIKSVLCGASCHSCTCSCSRNAATWHGHSDAIEAARDLLRRVPAARAKVGHPDEFQRRCKNLIDQRHLADYHPYGTNAPGVSPIDFVKESADAALFARHILEKVREYIAWKEASNP